MKSEIIKQTFRLGNSAGVLLPINWNDRKVKIQLIDKSITQDIFEILEEKDLLKNVISIFLAGSYARGEETESSDVDILVITDDIDKQMKIREYEIIMISKEKFKNNIRKSLYLASLINESKTILNDSFIEDYKIQIKNIPIKKSLENIKSMMKVNRDFIEISKQTNEKILDETIYSIILRLRELYLIDCLRNNKKPSNKEFIKIIKKITGSIEAYNSYLRIKEDKPPKEIISSNSAKKLIDYMTIKIKSLEHGKKN
jgi:predicted nucleotidyltransferase